MSRTVLEAIAADSPEDDGPTADWCEGFEAAQSYAEACELRLECLREAVKLCGNDQHGTMTLAREMYRFVTGQTCDDCGGELHGEREEGTVQ